MRSPFLSAILPALIFGINGVQALTSYANDFVNPDFIVAGDFANNTLAAQATILAWAKDSASKGPWFWKLCKYVSRDGLFNPDGRLINDVGNFQALADAVLYNSIAFSITGKGITSSSYSKTVVSFIKAWFLDPETKMNPNLNYAQMERGPTGQVGSHTGILDLKCMAKIVSGIMILRKKKCTDWTDDLDGQMNAWAREYITWLETAPISLEEGDADNNHGTFYYNQLAALKFLIGDFPGALNVTNTYFSRQYMSQIVADGEQPLEAARTRPYHYHAYNLAAMITNARIATYAGDKEVWNKTTNAGSTIKTALDFSLGLSAAATKETTYTTELYPSIAAVASVYGDPEGKYASFLANGVPGFALDAYFLWNQPLAGGEAESAAIVKAFETSTSQDTKATPSTGSSASTVKGNGATVNVARWSLVGALLVALEYTLL
ncbi:hypothetical protein H0H81_009594 [Sphagnurus paluster]|uniref:Alginate lyase domain-containing protein n=1 Tax=Sphagnurus paluster TaxID=117069 RepID=A0A9P7FRI5_9AGAR|nr:hypothetical protein H0H81_009594 [Sphagnurus paluster]